MDTIQVAIKADEGQQEILIGFLSELDPEGFEQSDTHLLVYFKENLFPSYEVNQIIGDFEHEVVTIPAQNWNAVWESNFQPVVISGFCAIRAGFHEPVEGVQYDIVITPKMSFGTGHHATTYMMMEQMKELPLQDATVFDFGTGTGILAILAEKLGARSVKGIDLDPWSMENAKENIHANGCTKIEIALASTLPSEIFDVVLANINRNVILQQLDGLKAMLHSHSRLLLSGLMTADQEIIVEECNHKNLELVKRSERDNWISLLFVNKR